MKYPKKHISIRVPWHEGRRREGFAVLDPSGVFQLRERADGASEATGAPLADGDVSPCVRPDTARGRRQGASASRQERLERRAGTEAPRRRTPRSVVLRRQQPRPCGIQLHRRIAPSACARKESDCHAHQRRTTFFAVDRRCSAGREGDTTAPRLRQCLADDLRRRQRQGADGRASP